MCTFNDIRRSCVVSGQVQHFDTHHVKHMGNSNNIFENAGSVLILAVYEVSSAVYSDIPTQI